MKKIIILILALPSFVLAAGDNVQLDRAPDRSNNLPALQHGAKVYVNYCLNCHGLSFLRYNKLQELGISEEQIKDNLLFTADKVGERMSIAMRSKEAKQWFGVAPLDLSVITKARASGLDSGADWLYTYLRSFYRDKTTPTGWNNVIFPNVAMPHVLWELQGDQELTDDKKLKLVKKGRLTSDEFDEMAANLTGFLVWAAEPDAQFRKTVGTWVLIVLLLLLVVSYALKREYWKDVN